MIGTVFVLLDPNKNLIKIHLSSKMIYVTTYYLKTSVAFRSFRQ
jgi:hypothetical protein